MKQEEQRVECERCKRTVERAGSEWVAIPSRVAEPVEALLCARCADEVRQGLLRWLGAEVPLRAPSRAEQEVPLPAPPRAEREVPPPAPSRAEREVPLAAPPPVVQEVPRPAPSRVEQEARSSIRARAGWFVLRIAAYAVIAVAVFALVTWLSIR